LKNKLKLKKPFQKIKKTLFQNQQNSKLNKKVKKNSNIKTKIKKIKIQKKKNINKNKTI
jgi:hypothetical protein